MGDRGIFISTPIESPRHNDFRWVGCPQGHRGVTYRHPNRLLLPTGMHILGGQPWHRLARSPLAWMAIQSPAPSLMLPTHTARKSFPSARLGRGRVISLSASDSCSPRARRASLSTKPVPAATGSLGP